MGIVNNIFIKIVKSDLNLEPLLNTNSSGCG